MRFFSRNRSRWGLVRTFGFLGAFGSQSVATSFSVAQVAKEKATSASAGKSTNLPQGVLPLEPERLNRLKPLTGQKGIERSPAFSPLELEIERLSDGRLRVKSVDPQGPFGGLVEENQVFEKFEDIPKPKNSHSD